MNERPRSLFFPMALIAAGLIWLLVNFGTIPAANLWALAYLWPFLLIGLGLSLILRPYWAESGIFISALLVIGAVAAVIYAPNLGWAGPAWGWTRGSNAGGSIRGSGNLETETRSPGAFSEIEIRYPADILIQQGEEESVTVTADDNLLPQLQTAVSSGMLVIDNSEDGWNRRVRASQTIQITITVQEVNEITFDSAGSVEINDLTGSSLLVTLQGAGSIEMNSVTLDRLEVSVQGAGSMEASGEVDHLVVSIDGLGSLNAEGLTAQTAEVSVDGLGSATVRVDQDLVVRIDGLGSVNYYGSPELHEETDGLGSVHRLGD